MTSTVFSPGTVITTPWLNDVNKAAYTAIGDGSAVPSNATDVRTNLAVETTAANRAALAASSGSSLVGYLPAGTGAVATTVQSKLRESVSVLDFGASPSASAAVNAVAFTVAWAASNPKAVLVPASTYLFTGTVTGKFYSFGAVTISGGTVTSITNLVP